MTSRLHVVQTPAPAATGSAYRWDASRPAPHTDMLRAAWNDGETTGFRAGYLKGWRWGLLCGACTTVAGLVLCLAAGRVLGWL